MRDVYQRELWVAATYAAMLIFLAIKVPDFFKPEQVRATLVSSAPVLVAAVGMTLVIVARQIDISIASQFSVCGVVAGLLARAGLPMPAVGLGTLLARSLGWAAISGLARRGPGPASIVVDARDPGHPP